LSSGLRDHKIFAMEQPANPDLNSDQPPLTLRPEQSADEPLLLDLYATTRQEELALTNWDAATRAAFVSLQFKAMRQGYANMFPHGQFSIVMLGDLGVGRMVVNRAGHEIRLVDMVLAPNVRCHGIGSRLVHTLQTEARQAGKPLSLHVLKGNRAARFYERLGFSYSGDAGLYHEMTWSPSTGLSQSESAL
jgi:ribosomal protein S18 acetylase RimI-like enzyme